MQETKDLQKKLFKNRKTGWEKLSDDELKNIFQFDDEYMY